MAKTTRKKKHTGLTDFNKRASSILASRGFMLGFLNGPNIEGTTVIGFEDLTKTERTTIGRNQLILAMENNLRNTKRTWTVIYGLLLEKEDEDGSYVEPIVDYFYVDNAAASDLDKAATVQISEEIHNLRTQLVADGTDSSVILGNVSLAIPYKITKDPEDILIGLDDHLTSLGIFDVDKLKEAIPKSNKRLKEWAERYDVEYTETGLAKES